MIILHVTYDIIIMSSSDVEDVEELGAPRRRCPRVQFVRACGDRSDSKGSGRRVEW